MMVDSLRIQLYATNILHLAVGIWNALVYKGMSLTREVNALCLMPGPETGLWAPAVFAMAPARGRGWVYLFPIVIISPADPNGA